MHHEKLEKPHKVVQMFTKIFSQGVVYGLKSSSDAPQLCALARGYIILEGKESFSNSTIQNECHLVIHPQRRKLLYIHAEVLYVLAVTVREIHFDTLLAVHFQASPKPVHLSIPYCDSPVLHSMPLGLYLEIRSEK